MIFDEAAASDILFLVISAHPTVAISEQTAAVWAEALGDLDVDDVREGVFAVLQKSKSWPTIAEVRREAILARITGRSHLKGAGLIKFQRARENGLIP